VTISASSFFGIALRFEHFGRSVSSGGAPSRGELTVVGVYIDFCASWRTASREHRQDDKVDATAMNTRASS